MWIASTAGPSRRSKKVTALRMLTPLGIALTATMMLAQAAVASIVYDGYPNPPPGGDTVTGSIGQAIGSGGKTWNYTGFNTSAYGSLYYGIDLATFSIQLSTGAGPDMSFDSTDSNLATGLLVFSGSALGDGTRFVLHVTDSSSNPLALTSASSLGLPGSDGAALIVTPALAAARFNANWQF